jgi:hypothetical protein
MEYFEDPIAKALSYWNENPEEEWQNYKSYFATRSKTERVNDLVKVDSWLGGELKPTHETADLWTKRRELEILHRRLDRLGNDAGRCNTARPYTQ